VDLGAGLDDLEKRKFLTLSGLEMLESRVILFLKQEHVISELTGGWS
jgi:hypothetical protein